MIDLPDTLPDWLADAIRKRTIEEGDCLIWQGWVSGGSPKMVRPGWRELGLKTKGVSVRREIAAAIKKQPIRKRMFPMTSCGDERCVNPAHVVQRNWSQLMKAAADKSDYTIRARKVSQARRRNSRLTPEAVADIKAAPTCAEAAKKHGISKSHASGIRNGKSWTDHDIWSAVFARLAA
jgi:hypothetical protein